MRLPLASAALVLLASQGALAASVSCDDPDNLCTGDPCEIPQVEVISPCVVDFGARDLVLAGKLSVPNAGVLSFTAASITAMQPISGQHLTGAQGDGASVTLIATGDIETRRVDVSGLASAGSITLQAGGAVRLRRLLRAAAAGTLPSAAGGSIDISAGAGGVTGDRPAKLDVRGAKNGKLTPAGTVSVQSDASITLGGKIFARGTSGGAVAMSGVDVILDNRIDALGTELTGGSLAISATSDILLSDRVNVSGETAGGTVDLLAGESAIFDRSIRLRSSDGPGGALTMVAAAGLAKGDDVDARGEPLGGTIDVSATSLASFDRLIAVGRIDGGSISVVSTGGDVTVRDAHVGAAGSGSQDAGEVVLTSLGGDVTVGKRLELSSDGGAGGEGNLEASGQVKIEGTIAGSGATAGATARISGASVALDRRVELAGGTQGGSLILEADAGGAVVDDGVDATGPAGGVIQMASGGDLTLSGEFLAATGGCIGLSATGTLDTSDATFDGAVLSTCGASPSGAFLDGPAFF